MTPLEPRSLKEFPVEPEYLNMRTTTVTNGVLRLEPMGADPDRYREMAHRVWTDPVVAEFNSVTDFLTPYQIDTWLNNLLSLKNEIFWAVVRADTGAQIGLTGWEAIEWHRFGEKQCELSRELLPEGRGQGFGKMLDFMHLGMAKKAGFRHLVADVHEGNIASMKSRSAQFGQPVPEYNDYDEKTHFVYTADLRNIQLPPDQFLVYAPAPVRPAKA